VDAHVPSAHAGAHARRRDALRSRILRGLPIALLIAVLLSLCSIMSPRRASAATPGDGDKSHRACGAPRVGGK
jgi:hypothetical protein